LGFPDRHYLFRVPGGVGPVNAMVNPGPKIGLQIPPRSRVLAPFSSVLAIDPGAKSGWALSRDQVIVAAGLVRLDRGDRVRLFTDLTEVWCELPQWQCGDTPARINDLFTTARRAGALVVQACPGWDPENVHWIAPHAWKGSVDKAVHNERVRKRLAAGELLLLQDIPQTLVNNVLDAIGLNMYATGRYRP